MLLGKKTFIAATVCFSALFLANVMAEEKTNLWDDPTEEKFMDKEPVLKVLANDEPTTDESTEEKKI